MARMEPAIQFIVIIFFSCILIKNNNALVLAQCVCLFIDRKKKFDIKKMSETLIIEMETRICVFRFVMLHQNQLSKLYSIP